MSFTRSPAFPLLSLLTNLTAVGSATFYLHSWNKFIYEENEARMDEIEGTLRGHTGLIEESLDRLEGKAGEKDTGKKMNDYYGKRTRDEKEKRK